MCNVTATSKSGNEKTLDTKLCANTSEFKPKHNVTAVARLKMKAEFKKWERLERHGLKYLTSEESNRGKCRK